MTETNKKADIIPVKKETERFNPRRLLTPFEELEHWVEDLFPENWFRQHRWPSSNMLSSSFEMRMPKVERAKRRSIKVD